jgi:hypothetical protein
MLMQRSAMAAEDVVAAPSADWAARTLVAMPMIRAMALPYRSRPAAMGRKNLGENEDWSMDRVRLMSRRGFGFGDLNAD